MNPIRIKQRSQISTGRLLIAILLISALLLTACASLSGQNKTKPELVVITALREVKSLANGNYEVTPAWLQERYEYEAWITEQLENRVCPMETEPGE